MSDLPLAIIIAARSTPASRVSFQAAQIADQELRTLGFPVKFLRGVKATRPFVEKTLSSSEGGRFVIYAGHGEPDAFLGNEPLQRHLYSKLRPIDLDNMALLKDDIVYAISCHTLAELGQKAPARAFIGFNSRVRLDATDWNDDAIPDFVECFLEPIEVLSEGGTVSEAVQSFKDISNAFIQKAGINGADADYVARMKHNIEAIGYSGDPFSRVISP
ncbi:MAG: hypothetical protein UY48_C0049G0006 [Candidatus Gottesmanbacteria bacterium GW2011_GWB1_49_7]|uniref:CHAT domain-containing protein n=1 Tax=Candidatus Gottesmanbacteria bacterium GW2011_GWB1_49_7 TaxID=1618448 RepID=A0A0G1VU56_9BACT|nr:MAG: hypothetical protein UY48_C0049G0006 [Candidatus Gottesmanbacteria bacterium GW2011_GWB1_49_7]